MADLSDNQSAQTVKVTGADSAGAEQTPVQSTANGGLHTNLRNTAGTEIGTSAAPIRTDPTGTTTQPVALDAASLAALESITVQNPSGAGAVNIQDGGNSITVDGTVDLGATTLAALESITVQNPSGAGAVNVQDGGNSLTVDSPQLPATLGQKSMTASLPVVIASDQSTLPVSAAALPLPAGASTSALQTTGNNSLASIDAGIPAALGQTTMAASMSVAIASDQSTLPISAAALPLPAGAATSAKQDTGNTSVASLDTKTPTIGQKTMAGSRPVVIASDQVLTVASSPLPTTGSGFAFGSLATSTSAAFLIVEATAYTEQTVNGQRSIASASANDAAAGTGARTVKIIYYDQTMAGPFTETLTLNGTTGVNTVNTNICYIEDIIVLTVGSTGSNAGIISLYTATAKGGSVFASIAALANQTFYAHHYVATGKTCYISGLSFSSNATAAGNGGIFILKASTPTVANSAPLQVSDFNHLMGSSSNTVTRSYISPIQVVGPAKVAAYVLPDANGATIQYASFDYIDN